MSVPLPNPDEVLPPERRESLMRHAELSERRRRHEDLRARETARLTVEAREGTQYCPRCKLQLARGQFRLGSGVCWLCAATERKQLALAELDKAREEARQAYAARQEMHAAAERKQMLDERKRHAAGERD